MINHGRLQEMALKGYWFEVVHYVEFWWKTGVIDKEDMCEALYALDMGWSE